MIEMLDSLAAIENRGGALIRLMEESLFGEDKDTFLSPS